MQKLFTKDEAWARFVAANGGEEAFRPAVIDNVSRFLACGSDVIGHARHECSNPECGHSKVVSFSCNSRFCNTCGKKKTDQWITQQREVLPKGCDWQHITFTMPGELWEIIEHNRWLIKKLSKLAAGTLQDFAEQYGLMVGIFCALHTFGRDLKFNTHVHVSITCGGLNKHGKWKKLRYVKNVIMPKWRYAIIDLLRQSLYELTLPDHLRPLISNYQDWNQWLNKHYQKPWIVHFAKIKKGHARAVKYLGSYIKRPPLSLSRLKHYDGTSVVFEYLDHKTKTKKWESCSTEDFFARLIRHIPDKHFRLITYYGFLSNRLRGELLPTVYEQLGEWPNSVETLYWHQMFKAAFGSDPMRCVLCGSQMVLVEIVPGIPRWKLYQNHWAISRLKPIQ